MDSATHGSLDTYGLSPRRFGELRDVIPMAFLHHGFEHLASNTVPLLVLGFLAALSGLRRFAAVVLTIMIIGGLGVWLTATDHSNTVGASGVIFGLLGYLLVRGFVNRSATDIVVGLIVLVVYGSALWGVLPSDPVDQLAGPSVRADRWRDRGVPVPHETDHRGHPALTAAGLPRPGAGHGGRTPP